MPETRAANRRRTAGPQQQRQQQQPQDDEERKAEEAEEAEEQGMEEGAALVALPAANWRRRGDLLEDCLVGGGVMPRELVGIVDGYCGHDFESMSVVSS